MCTTPRQYVITILTELTLVRVSLICSSWYIQSIDQSAQLIALFQGKKICFHWFFKESLVLVITNVFLYCVFKTFFGLTLIVFAGCMASRFTSLHMIFNMLRQQISKPQPGQLTIIMESVNVLIYLYVNP